MGTLHDKVVLITGGSSGIGRATALRLAEQGARIALSSRRADALEEAAGEVRRLGAEALVVPADVTEPEQVRRAYPQLDAFLEAKRRHDPNGLLTSTFYERLARRP